jgi:hypothetical protein
MIPQSTGLADLALQHVMTGPRLDHAYLDRDKWAHDPGRMPEAHDHLVLHADDSPEIDSHVKALAREIAQHSGLTTVFTTKDGAKGPVSWRVDNPASLRPETDV